MRERAISVSLLESTKTFSIGSSMPGFDESAHASRVAAHLGTDHESLVATQADALETAGDAAAAGLLAGIGRRRLRLAPGEARRRALAQSAGGKGRPAGRRFPLDGS